MRVCKEPGCGAPVARDSLCRRHLIAHDHTRNERRRGRYRSDGGAHRRRKIQLIREALPGITRCSICRRPFTEEQLASPTRVHLHHLTSPPRVDQTALAHARCNLAAGQPTETRPA